MQHILFTDVDRTLLTHTYQVLPEVKRAFDLANEVGLKVVFVTARAPDSLLPIAKILNNTGICCCFGGGWVGDLASCVPLESHRIPNMLAAEIMQMATKMGTFPVWYDDRAVFAPVINDVVELQLRNVGEKASPLDEATLPSCPMKIMIIDRREDSSLSQIASSIESKATVSFSHRHLLEIGPKNVDKGTGLKAIEAMFRDAKVMTHAVGDAENDIPLLKAANHRYTVSNGLSELKDMSEFVGKSCDEAGLADVIKFIIGKYI